MKTQSSILKKIVLLTTIAIMSLLSLGTTVYGLYISEIMFNPDGADTGREWIELTAGEDEECINLSSYKLFEGNTNHNIYSYDNDLFCKYAVICNDINKFLQDNNSLNLTAYDSDNISIYRSSFSLSNTGEELAIKKDTMLIDYINYSIILEYVSVEEGYSLEFIDDVWRQSADIGGSAAIYPEILVMDENESDQATSDIQDNTTTIPENMTSTQDNITIDSKNDSISDSITIENSTTENINIGNNTNNDTAIESNITSQDTTPLDEQNYSEHIYGNETNATNATTPTTSQISQDNSTQNFTPNIDQSNNDTDIVLNTTGLNKTTPNTTLCNISLKIYLKNDSLNPPHLNDNNIQIKFYTKIESHNNAAMSNYSIEYWIEDTLGKIVKNKLITNNQNEKSYTPKIDESDKVLILKAMIKDTECSVYEGYDEELILVQNKGYVKPECLECDSKKIKCEPCDDKVTIDESIFMQECTSTFPSIKVINVCNYSNKSSTEKSIKSIEQDKLTSNFNTSTQSQILGIQALSDNNSRKETDKGMTTGMIVYESPNVQNRFYAIVGFVLVSIALIILIAYKKIFKQHKQDIRINKKGA